MVQSENTKLKKLYKKLLKKEKEYQIPVCKFFSSLNALVFTWQDTCALWDS